MQGIEELAAVYRAETGAESAAEAVTAPDASESTTGTHTSLIVSHPMRHRSYALIGH